MTTILSKKALTDSPIYPMISLTARFLDLIAPRNCMICNRRLAADEDTLCAICNLHLPRTGFHADPYENEMARMLWGRIRLERCGAWFYYKGGSDVSHLIYNLKYNDHPETGVTLGRTVADEYLASGFFNGIDIIVPIPLSRGRLRERGYNQSREIARGISRVTGIKVNHHAVSRSRFQESQVNKHRWERADNVENTFHLQQPENIRGKHILIVDDVATTGATICACARELSKAGGVTISVLTLGYTKP